MKAIIFTPFWIIFYLLIITFSFIELDQNSQFKLFNTPAIAEAGSKNINPDIVLGENTINPSTYPSQDIRIVALHKFFAEIKSPLYYHVEEIIKQADLYGIDYALVPAISMQESNGCKVIPSDSYNCWGFGIYGDKITRFGSYELAIARVSKIIKESYIKKGLTNPTLLEDRWAPPSRGVWSYAVNYYISLIHNLERNIPAS